MDQNHIKIKKIDLDLELLTRECKRINNKIIKTFKQEDIPVNKKYQAILSEQLMNAPQSSKLHDHYNIFSFPYEGINSVYREVCVFFKQVCQYDQPYYIHAWLNYGEKNSFIPWHNHWGALSGLKETYVCTYYINAEPSTTEYKFPNGYNHVMHNKNNVISLYEDVGDTHQANPWLEDQPRITISMDMVPMKYIRLTPFLMNTWIPIL